MLSFATHTIRHHNLLAQCLYNSYPGKPTAAFAYFLFSGPTTSFLASASHNMQHVVDTNGTSPLVFRKKEKHLTILHRKKKRKLCYNDSNAYYFTKDFFSEITLSITDFDLFCSKCHTLLPCHCLTSAF